MTKFNSKEEMITAYVNQMAKMWEVQGMTTNSETERKQAEQKMMYIPESVSQLIHKLPEKIKAYQIVGFNAYCPA